ncbi:MAG: hypothetical protein A3A47_04835 [Candidatus Levybacteria bacterium RIFCSPLOWO2_01_FULL_37_20]|nr:MAG: hypothetical protein A3A47_04835 [Candidatus Levybacteria bacterium RIFCSPLOWO2_01_FULL_37_20]OGH44826.1 MAG: hypothetical protein A3J14_05370 [Candidatus Levybacteria bacterium RIFCSPLOWO2_02_FULL_37_18]
MKLSKLQKGFTLIELLVVIAVLAVLATGVLVLIDPVDKIAQANDSKVENDVGAIGRAAAAYSVTHQGFYPVALSDLVTAGELRIVPVPPTASYGTAYTVIVSPTGCVAGSTCSSFAVGGPYRSKRYTSVVSSSFFRYEADTGKAPCRIGTFSLACP